MNEEFAAFFLLRKDTFGIFTYPVTDAIAPNYSQVVKTPMDFSTMMYKIENSQYQTIRLFKVSIILQSNNVSILLYPDHVSSKFRTQFLNIY